MQIPKAGTTILTMKYKDGVVVAGDRRITYGNYHYDNYSKVEYIDNLTLIAFSGSVPAIQHLAQDLVTERELWEDLIEEKIYVDGQSELLKNIIREKFFSEVVWTGSVALPIIAGFDPRQKTGRIFDFDILGGIYEMPYHIARGSGGIIAEPILKRLWSANMTLDQARRLAIDAILQASFDIHTSPPHLAPASVFAASADGVVYMSDEDALNVALELVNEATKRVSQDGK